MEIKRIMARLKKAQTTKTTTIKTETHEVVVIRTLPREAGSCPDCGADLPQPNARKEDRSEVRLLQPMDTDLSFEAEVINRSNKKGE